VSIEVLEAQVISVDASLASIGYNTLLLIASMSNRPLQAFSTIGVAASLPTLPALGCAAAAALLEAGFCCPEFAKAMLAAVPFDKLGVTLQEYLEK
jgi:hypothetical protein